MKRSTWSWAEYERRKRAWAATHPSASSADYEQACRRIAAALGL